MASTIGMTSAMVAAALLSLCQSALADATPCERSAQKMFGACRADLREEVKVTKANCLNVSDAEERATCREDATDLVGEERESCDDQRDARREVCELLGEFRYDPDPLEDPSIDFVDLDEIGQVSGPAPNPYFNLTIGRTYVLRAGEDFEEIVVVYVIAFCGCVHHTPPEERRRSVSVPPERRNPTLPPDRD